jgi:alcohol dehydrogenase
MDNKENPMYEFHWPTKTLFGAGLIQEIENHIRPRPGNAVLMITAPQEPWIQPLVKSMAGKLLEAGWKSVPVFAQIEPNPSWNTVQKGAAFASQNNVTAILAVGGGSTMDASKVIAEQCSASFLCTVPTTAGTGGEISPWAVISNTETREKDSVTSKWPDLTLLDPELTCTLPPSVTLMTGIDAFIHGLEAFLSSAANPITDALALKGMQLINRSLETALEDGEDLPARSDMLQGSLLTGAAMLHAGLGLMHAIGNVTGGLYHELPHGLILIQCMDAVLEYNLPVTGEKFKQIESMVNSIRDLSAHYQDILKIPDVRIQKHDLPILAERAHVNVNAKTNPREADPEVIKIIVQESFMVR